jgi:uncharacterized membrane protein YebE (DUF533 family)
MIKLYKTNREVQLQWMRENPGKTIALNLLVAAGFLAYIAYQDRKERKRWSQETEVQD